MTTERKYVTLLSEGPLTTLTISRPEKLNALDASVVLELASAVAEVRTHHGTRCLIVTGAGEKAFCAGADIAEMSAMRLDEARAFATAGHAALAAFL